MRTRIILVIGTLAAAAAFGQPDAGRVFHLTNPSTPQQYQEIATVIRSVGDIPDLLVDARQKTVTVGGTPAQMAMAAWLVKELDQPAGDSSRASEEYRGPDGDDVMCVFYLAHAPNPQSVQEMITLIRSIADVQRIFAYNARKAIALRGEAEPVRMAEWLVNELDKPSPLEPSPAAHEYRPPGSTGDVVRVFYLAHAGSAQALQKSAAAVRSATDIQRIFFYTQTKALAVRGTEDQVASAARQIRELDKP